jgi:ArsR family transcriptional regulator, arsenate/arsenite/antimonite-responsive transcriptional repressor
MTALIQLEPSITLSAEQNLSLGLEGAAWIFKALADPARLKILQFLATGQTGCCGDGVCGCDLEEVTGLSQPTVSHHMKCLASAGLVTSEKRGKWMYYSLDARGFKMAKAMLEHCC